MKKFGGKMKNMPLRRIAMFTIPFLTAIWLLFPSGLVQAGIIVYQYDDAHRLVGVDYGDQKQIRYTYDPMGNLLQRVSTFNVTLEDAIYVLQILAGSPSDPLPLDIDVNQDDQLGKEEALFILQQVAGMR